MYVAATNNLSCSAICRLHGLTICGIRPGSQSRNEAERREHRKVLGARQTGHAQYTHKGAEDETRFTTPAFHDESTGQATEHRSCL